MKHPIVAGTDLTEASDDTLIQAERRATRDAVPLTVVHAVPPRLWAATQASEDLEQIACAIRERVSALTGREGSEFEVLVERGAAHIILPRVASARNALLVVGSHLERGIGHALLRDVTERVVSRFAGPVLATRAGCESGRILVAVDNSFRDAATLDAAIEEASGSGAQLMVIHCVYMGFLQTLTVDLMKGGAYGEDPLWQRSVAVDARRGLAVELKRRNVNAELHVVDGPPDVLIPDFAAQLSAELVIVGSPHYPAAPSHVATAVLRRARCSVLVVDTGRAPVESLVAQHAAAN
ncbi:MAG: universal stress protein [Polyangiaceae bacterium]